MTVIISTANSVKTFERTSAEAGQMARTYRDLGWYVERQENRYIISREIW